MITAMIFDLDGVLVQSEKMKAQAYAEAARRLLGLPEPDNRTIEAYRKVVGEERQTVSKYIMEQLGLEESLRPLQKKYKVKTPQEVLSIMQVEIYEKTISDARTVIENQWPHNMEMLRIAKETFCKTALVTMSNIDEVHLVLKALKLENTFDAMVTGDEVLKGKPDPEIYLLAASRLQTSPSDCLVLEDSANGVKSALAAGMNVIAVVTPFTRAGIHSEKIIDRSWIVENPKDLPDVVRKRITAHNLVTR